jgi:nucleoside-diphosphate-sugar epimerase
MRETDEVRRDQPYALSKRSAEEALALLAAAGAGGMRVTCVRLFGVFGPEQAAGLVPGVVARVREGRPVVLERNPRDAADRDGLRMSLTYVADLAACLAALGEAMRDGRDVPALLNVAGTEAVSIRRLAERAGAAIGAVPRFEEVDRDRESDYVADVTRLQHLLRPRFTPLDAALAGTVA